MLLVPQSPLVFQDTNPSSNFGAGSPVHCRESHSISCPGTCLILAFYFLVSVTLWEQRDSRSLELTAFIDSLSHTHNTNQQTWSAGIARETLSTESVAPCPHQPGKDLFQQTRFPRNPRGLCKTCEIRNSLGLWVLGEKNGSVVWDQSWEAQLFSRKEE